MFYSKQKSIFKLLLVFILMALFTATCADESKNLPTQQLASVQASQKVKENIVYPKGTAVVDVTTSEFGAIPNDGKDDTKAIQKALLMFPNGGRIIYLPNGTYNISDSLYWPPGIPGASDYKRTLLQGQSRDGVIIRLKDGSPKFQDLKNPRPVISTGFNPDVDRNSEEFRASIKAQRFGNYVRNLTINIGKNNPGAEGLNFVANNYGAVRSVKIISEDTKGTVGLALTHGEIGPLLVENVEIVGFTHGILTNNYINSITMQNITVRNQQVSGLHNRGQVMSIEGFYSDNSVTAIVNGDVPRNTIDAGSTLTLVNAKLIGNSNAKNLSAIHSSGFIYARNIESSGYKNILSSDAIDAVRTIEGSTIKEYSSHPILSLFPSPSQSLKLPIKQFPVLPFDDLKRWVSVEKFGAIPEDKKDDTSAFQAAIDSGATTVFVPRTGAFTINGSLRLRGNVRRFIGTTGLLEGSGEIIVDNGIQPTLIIEDFGMSYGSSLKWKNVTSRTVVYRNIANLNLESKGTGDLFLDDVVTPPAPSSFKFLNSAQNIWGRKINTEVSDETNVVNQGAKLWILGLKTEGSKIKIDTTNGGSTELLGAFIYAAGKQYPSEPLFRIANASASFAGVADAFFDRDRYEIWVEETRGSTTRKLMVNQAYPRRTANGDVMTLYTGFKS
jgi:hypothetical protein